MACAQRIVVAETCHPGLPTSVITPGRRRLALLAAGAIALLATACGSGSGGGTPCSVYTSMDSSDQMSTVTTMLQQFGESNPSSDDVSAEQRSASAYCSVAGLDGTIDGVADSLPGV
jgi:hypothetical protein